MNKPALYSLKSKVYFYRDLSFILLSLLLLKLTFSADENDRLIIAGLFLAIHALLYRKENGNAYLFELFASVIALIVAFFPNQYFLLFIFYSLLLVVFIWIVYSYRKDRFKEKRTKMYRFSYILGFSLLAFLIIKIMKAVLSYSFLKPISSLDYFLFILVSIVSLINFFLIADNIIKIIPNKVKKVVVGNEDYRVTDSVFLALSINILIGGYFYINNSENPVIKEIMIVLGVAFFTSLVVADTLKRFFKN